MPNSRPANALVLLLYLLLASLCPANAQGPETRIVPVTIVTADGKPLTDLQLRNIRIHGRKVQLKSFRLDTGPRRIVLLLDTSGSMAISNGKVTLWQAAVHTARLFLDTLPSADWVSVHVFAEKDKQVVPFTHDFGLVRAAIAGLPKPATEEAKSEYGARTDLDNALKSVLATLSDRHEFGDAVVIFSDGFFPRSDEGDILSYFDPPDYLQHLMPKMGVQGVRIFFSLAGNVTGAPPLHGIELFMGNTGGESFELSHTRPPLYSQSDPYAHPDAPTYRSDSLEQRVFANCAAVQDTYRLQLQFAQSLVKPARLRLDVVDGRGKALRNVVVLSPQFVYPDTAPAHH